MSEIHVTTQRGKSDLGESITNHCSQGLRAHADTRLFILGCGNTRLMEEIVYETVSRIERDHDSFENPPDSKICIVVAESICANAKVGKSLCYQVAADIISYAGNVGFTKEHLEKFVDSHAEAEHILHELADKSPSSVTNDMIHTARTILWIEALTFFTSHVFVWHESSP